jgi:hypothetical protein
VYRDLNDNGVQDSDEPVEKGALITTGTRQADRPTDARGTVTVAGLATYTPVAIGIDETSLADPMLVPKKALQVVVPRPGVPAEVRIGLVGGGDIEGALVKSGGLGFEGVDLELVDVTGKVVGTARTDFDGFFLFERIAYGDYSLRVTKDSAAAAKIASELGTRITVRPDKSIVRLGAIAVRPLPVLASAGPSPAAP